MLWVQFPVVVGSFLLKSFEPLDVNKGLKCKCDLVKNSVLSEINKYLKRRQCLALTYWVNIKWNFHKMFLLFHHILAVYITNRSTPVFLVQADQNKNILLLSLLNINLMCKHQPWRATKCHIYVTRLNQVRPLAYIPSYRIPRSEENGQSFLSCLDLIPRNT